MLELDLVSRLLPVNLAALFQSIPAWRPLADVVRRRFSPDTHGDYARWRRALDELPEIEVDHRSLGGTVRLDGKTSHATREALRAALYELHPWRKGPFELFGVRIDSEWRSDWKWQRLATHLGSLEGREILDVGCGNGYFGWRMLDAGATRVIGIDRTLLYCMQHLAINRYLEDARNWVLPLAFEELPAHRFDLVCSMGVVYHQREPQAHVRRLSEFTKPGGQVMLESLVVDAAESLEPAGRYARMRNVHVVPTIRALCGWLDAAGFTDPVVADVTPTTIGEQRSTRWMRFQSLADALDPQHPERTVEGHPAPSRALVLARRPARGKARQKRVRSS